MTHYFDNAATTPMSEASLQAMLPLLQQDFGNPSGAHRMARAANRVLDESREAIAGLIGFTPGELIFTSGGTEANNMAIRGAVQAASESTDRSEQPPTPLCSAIEHHAILDPTLAVGGQAVEVTPEGKVDLERLEKRLQSLTDSESQIVIVSIMAANNETGVVQPIAEVAELVRQHAPKALLHCDAVQALCWLDLAEFCSPVDAVTLSAHKFGGPKGVGLLAVRKGAPAIAPLLLGGSQERSRRGGTQNVAGIAAMAAAATETVNGRSAAVPRVEALRNQLSDGIQAMVPGALETGIREEKVANISHFCFEGIESEALLLLLEKHDIMASAASSCASGAADPSHVLAAMGYDRALAFGSLRLSLGYLSTSDDVDKVLAVLPDAVKRLRERG